MNGDFQHSVRHLLKDVIIDAVREALPQLRELYSLPRESLLTEPCRLFRPRETAEMLGISERHLHRLTQDGIIPCIRLGRIVRYSSDGLQRWIADNEAIEPGRSATSSPPPRSISQSNTKPRTPTLTSLTAQTRNKQSVRKRRKAVTPATATAAKSKTRQRRPSPVQQTSIERTTNVTRHVRATSKSEPSDFDTIAKRIGISPAGMPAVTYADLIRIAGIDANTLHGFLCCDRDLPETAITRLREFFVKHSTTGEAQQLNKKRNKSTEKHPNRRTSQHSSSSVRNVRQFFAERLNIPIETFPQMTNGDVMRIAEVDIATLHRWACLGGELPAAAMAKLEQFFRDAIPPGKS